MSRDRQSLFTNIALTIGLLPLAAWLVLARYYYDEPADAFLMLPLGVLAYLFAIAVSVPMFVRAIGLIRRSPQRGPAVIAPPILGAAFLVAASVYLLPIFISVASLFAR